jgi:hypothetical protein
LTRFLSSSQNYIPSENKYCKTSSTCFILFLLQREQTWLLTIKNHPKQSIDFTMTPRFFAVAVLALQAATSPSLAFTPARILAGSQPTIMARQQMWLYGEVSTSDEIGAVSSMRAG